MAPINNRILFIIYCTLYDYFLALIIFYLETEVIFYVKFNYFLFVYANIACGGMKFIDKGL